MVKHLLVLIFILSSVPVFADAETFDEQDSAYQTSMDQSDEMNFVDEVQATDETDALVPCRVHARDRFGFIIGRFFSFKQPFGRCNRGLFMCQNFLRRTHRFGFCREEFFRRRFP